MNIRMLGVHVNTLCNSKKMKGKYNYVLLDKR